MTIQIRSHLLALLTLCVCFSVQESFARQSIKPTGAVTSPSPNVSQLNKFVDIPVGNYTGTPSVSVPVFTIPMNQIALPISLNYHASGLKVSEQSSWVGAGWSLSAGGTISRSIRGLPDEELVSQEKIGYFHMQTALGENIVKSNGDIDTGKLIVCDDDNNIYEYGANPGPVNPIEKVGAGIYDLEPDTYYFSSSFGSGKFVFDHNRNIRWLTASDAEITENAIPLNSSTQDPTPYWIVYTADGAELTFNTTEIHRQSDMCAEGGEQNPLADYRPDAWHLTQIKKGDEIIYFYYVQENINYQSAPVETKQVKVLDMSPAGGTGNYTPGSTFCIPRQHIDTYRLDRITSSNGYKVDFIANTAREDLSGSNMLEKVIVSLNGEIIKELKLNHSYYGESNEKHKLRLDGVDQLALEGTGLINLYQFDYHFDGYINEFPAHDSKARDLYGFYNGATANHTLIGEYKDRNYHLNYSNNADRKFNFDKAKVGTLKKITHATGGTQTFTYEPHDISSDKFLLTKEVEVYVGQQGLPGDGDLDAGTIPIEDNSDAVWDEVEFEMLEDGYVSILILTDFP
ncbi:MAG: hypothetical protein WBA74_18245, partial [Cyclobacteriaceae bacterium]